MIIFLIGLIVLLVGIICFFCAFQQSDCGPFIVGVVLCIVACVFFWFGPMGHDRGCWRLESSVSYRVLGYYQSGENHYAMLEETDGTVMLFSLASAGQGQAPLVIDQFYKANSNNVLVSLIPDNRNK